VSSDLVRLERLGMNPINERKWVYAVSGRKAKQSIPAKGGERRCLAMGVECLL
jgi:hypothetical protein